MPDPQPPVIMDYIRKTPAPGLLRGGLRVHGSFSKKSGPEHPLISIITVVLNGNKNLDQTIRSVLAQTYDNIEYIIIDGSSTDGSLETIRQYDSKIAYWISEPDRGIYDAMNKGIAASTGEIINLLNSDDYLEPEAAESVIKIYSSLRQPCIIYGNAYAVDDTYGVKAKMYSGTRFWLGMTINHQAMFVHRKIYSICGLYDNETYKFAADYDFLLRCFRNRVPFFGTDKCIVNYRNAGMSSTSTRYRGDADLINKKYFGTLSRERLFFLAFNFLWMPFKLNLRTILYRTLGAGATRKAVSFYRKISNEKN